MLSNLVDFLFPPRCGGCGRAGSWWCGTCRAQARPARVVRCSRCRRSTSVLPCPLCGAAGFAPAALVALLLHEGPLRNALHRLKYEDRPQLARPLIELSGELLLERVATDGCAPVVVPVPLHPLRLRARGYNQAAAIANEVSRTLGLEMAAGLHRVVDTPPQVGKSGVQRRAAVKGAFQWRGIAPPGVIVVDDVLTTGATLLECAHALRLGGCRNVQALALALG